VELERGTLDALVEYLEAHGYSSESMVVEYQLGKFRVDLALIDQETNMPSALFEIKQERNRSTENFGRKQLQSFLSYLGTKSIPAYLVFKKDSSPPFEIQRLQVGKTATEQGNEDTYSGKQLDSNIIQTLDSTALQSEKKHKARNTVNYLTLLCIGLIGILIVLLCLDAIDVIHIGNEHITIGGVIIALSLIPFASKLKLFGFFEWERRNEEKKKDN